MISRKVRRCGNSLIVQIPKKVRKLMNLNWGDSAIIIQEKDGKTAVFGIEKVEEVNRRMIGKEKSLVISVRKLLRQGRQMLVVIPRGNKNVDYFKFGETVEIQIEENGELKITRIFK